MARPRKIVDDVVFNDNPTVSMPEDDFLIVTPDDGVDVIEDDVSYTFKGKRGHISINKNAGEAAIAAAKGSSALLLPHVRASVKVIEDNGDFKVQVVDTAGNPRVNGKGEFLTIADLVSEMRQSDIFGRAFEATGTTGSGAASSGTITSKTIKKAAFDALKPAERAKAMQSGMTVVE